MKDTERKSRLFKQLWKLRDADEKFRALSIQNDLTKKEREENKLMNEAARQKRLMKGETVGTGCGAHSG